MKEYKRTDINKDLWINDYGNETFELFLRTSGQLAHMFTDMKKEDLNGVKGEVMVEHQHQNTITFSNQIGHNLFLLECTFCFNLK